MNKTKPSLQKIHITSAFSAPLRENRMLNLRHRQVSQPGENLQQLSDHVWTTTNLMTSTLNRVSMTAWTQQNATLWFDACMCCLSGTTISGLLHVVET